MGRISNQVRRQARETCATLGARLRFGTFGPRNPRIPNHPQKMSKRWTGTIETPSRDSERLLAPEELPIGRSPVSFPPNLLRVFPYQGQAVYSLRTREERVQNPLISPPNSL